MDTKQIRRITEIYIAINTLDKVQIHIREEIGSLYEELEKLQSGATKAPAEKTAEKTDEKKDEKPLSDLVKAWMEACKAKGFNVSAEGRENFLNSISAYAGGNSSVAQEILKLATRRSIGTPTLAIKKYEEEKKKNKQSPAEDPDEKINEAEIVALFEGGKKSRDEDPDEDLTF